MSTPGAGRSASHCQLSSELVYGRCRALALAETRGLGGWVTFVGVSGQGDPERLLAEALRAQAVRAPVASTGAVTPEPPLKLLSGTDQLLSGRVSETISFPAGPMPETTQLVAGGRQVSGWWIVLLAILLGLAAGAVVGLISII